MAAHRHDRESGRSRRPSNSCPPLENHTDLTPLKGREALVLVDEQNLSISARQLGYLLQYHLLARRIRNTARKPQLHVFIASQARDQKAERSFRRSGYVVHTKVIRHGSFGRRDSNIDNLFSYWTGIWTTRGGCEVMVLASGDYGLAGELAEAVRKQPDGGSREIMTLSLPGSTAQDLDARVNGNIAANMEIGLDLLRPNIHSNHRLFARALGNRRAFHLGRNVNCSY